MSETNITRCGLAAWHGLTTPWASMDELRKSLTSRGGNSALGQACKLSDEQTLLAIAAVLAAADRAGWRDRSFADWGVIAAPQYLGRVRLTAVLERFRKQSVRGASPLTVPHLSLHAVAATISVIIGSQGPSFGVGGAPGIIRDAMLNGLATVHGRNLPGLWLVSTCWTPEPSGLDPNQASVPVEGHAVAMALVPADSPDASHELVIRRHDVRLAVAPAPVSVTELSESLAMTERTGRCNLSLTPGFTMEVRRAAADSSQVRRVA